MKASEIIRETRNKLFERGWYQGSYDGPGGTLCVLGALDEVGSVDAYAACDAVIFVQRAMKTKQIALWNDAPGRTFDDVVDALDTAEKLAEQLEAQS